MEQGENKIAYRKLIAWQKADELAFQIYQITKEFPSEEKFGLVSQMRRAALSVAANIAEGYTRKSKKDKVHFYNIAQGSLTEIEYYLDFSRRLSYLPENKYRELMGLRSETGRLLSGLIRNTNTKWAVLLFFFLAPGLLFLVSRTAHAGTLSCTVATTCASGVVIWRMSGTSNAHAELPTQANYLQLVCCSGVTGLGTVCTGTFVTALKLSGTTNAHSEQNTQANYANNACISVPGGGSVSVGYQATNCTGFDTTLASMTGTTNAHVGDGAAYTTKICGTAVGGSQSLTFSISDSAIGFGTPSASEARYATGDGIGSAIEAEAHTLIASTNAANGYVITVNGTTLQSGSFAITAIGATNSGSSPGTEQFGLRMTATGGNGSVSVPYAAAGFALDTAAFPDEVASDPDGDNVSTTYSVRYLANIAGATEAASYSAALTYITTGQF